MIPIASSAEAGVKVVGEIATVTVELSNGASPMASDFMVRDVVIGDKNGKQIAGIGAKIESVVLQ